MQDKEGWLAAVLEKEPEAGEARLGREAASGGGRTPGCDANGLYATAALVRGALNAGEVPESAQSQARARGLALLEERYPARANPPAPPPGAWLGRLGSWLQVAFNLFRRR